jgi:hypothetical protein
MHKQKIKKGCACAEHVNHEVYENAKKERKISPPADSARNAESASLVRQASEAKQHEHKAMNEQQPD